MRALHRPLLALVAAEALILLAALAFVHLLPSTESGALFVHVFPYAVSATGVFMGWRFQRTRLLFALALLALAHTGLMGIAAWPAGDAEAHAIAVQTIALLLPANIAALAFIGERGLVTRAGGARLLTIGLQGVLVLLVAETARDDAMRLLSLALIPEHLLGSPRVGQLAAITFIVAGGVLIVRTLLTREPLTRALLWALAACYLAVASMPDSATTSLYLASAGLMLVVGTAEGAYAMAFRDDLTGLPARRALMERLAQLDEPYTVAMVDVDHFKQFNDRHGHDVGDQVLRMVAGRLARVGGGGRAFRYGGEEFTIVLPGTRLRDALPTLEAVRADVEQAGFVLRQPGRPRRKPKSPRRTGGGQRLSVTVSIGAAQRTERTPDAEQLLRAADRALYRAKDAGRNRVES